MKELVEYIAKSLVDRPDDVVVREIPGQQATIIELHVAGPDMGRVIGKRGTVINAIRSLVEVVAAREGKRVTLEVVE
jgi:predicted RNA-binding protein YlqC (UPF0109 family)